MNVKLNSLRTITDKDRLRTYCQAFSININDVVLANDKEAKKLKARGVKDFVEEFNKDHDLSWIDKSEVDILQSYSTGKLQEITNRQEFSDLANDNPIKQMLVKLQSFKQKYSKIMNILAYMDDRDSNKVSKMEDNVLDFLLSTLLGEWGDDQKMYLLLAKKLEK